MSGSAHPSSDLSTTDVESSEGPSVQAQTALWRKEQTCCMERLNRPLCHIRTQVSRIPGDCITRGLNTADPGALVAGGKLYTQVANTTHVQTPKYSPTSTSTNPLVNRS